MDTIWVVEATTSELPVIKVPVATTSAETVPDGTVPDGRKQDVGVSIGAAAADEMIASRVGDGRNDATIVYSKPEAPGVWQPPAGGAMALPWLGFVDPVV